jgi:hypothetical protein
MPETGTQRAVRFCYQCGRRVDSKRETCWYCGGDVHRTIKPSKPCPYCGTQIPGDAVKCRQCGEFLDGRKPPAAAAAPQQIVYVVDRALLQGGADRKLLPGQPVPPEIARRLSGPTVQAIEHNRPDLIDDPHVRALPAPHGGGDLIVDVDSQPIGGDAAQKDARRLLPGATRDLARTGGGSGSTNLPARREDTPQAVGGFVAGLLGGALTGLARFLVRTAPGRSKPQPDEVEVRTEERIRICEQCQTEILTTDSFCYHCGMQFHEGVSLAGKKLAIYPSNAGLFFTIALLAGALVWAGMVPPAFGGSWLRPLLGGLGVVLCGVAFMRRRTMVSQFVSLALTVVVLGVWLLF